MRKIVTQKVDMVRAEIMERVLGGEPLVSISSEMLTSHKKLYERKNKVGMATGPRK